MYVYINYFFFKNKQKNNMETKSFYELQKNLKEQNIMFCYSGYVTERILSAIGETIKKKLAIEETELGKTKKVFSIFVEGVQNVIRYSAESLGPEDQDESEVRYGLVTIGQDPKGISVQCGNLIYNKDVQKMKERVKQVEGKDKEQLKKLYKEKMMEGPEEGSKGASLGLVEMARRSGYPIEFAFEEINQEHTFFCIKAIV